jgi:hypothetical protein
MPSFSQSFLASLGQPRFAQGMFDVGQAIGGIGGQLAEKRRRDELSKFDTTTPEGQVGMLTSMIGAESDPVKRMQLSRQLTEMQREITEQARLTQQREGAENLAKQLEQAGETDIANLVRTGAMTPGQGTAQLNRIRTASRGVGARRALAKALNLEGSGVITEDAITNFTDAQFNKLLSAAEEGKERTALVDQLRKMDKGEEADLVEKGIYERSDVAALLKNPEEVTTFSGVEQKLVDDKIVWVGKVSEPGKSEYMGYSLDGKNWSGLGEKTPKDLPKEVSKTAGKISKTNVDTAAVHIANNPAYDALGDTGKVQAQYAVALLAQELMDTEGMTQNEALRTATEQIDFQKFDDADGAVDVGAILLNFLSGTAGEKLIKKDPVASSLLNANQTSSNNDVPSGLPEGTVALGGGRYKLPDGRVIEAE